MFQPSSEIPDLEFMKGEFSGISLVIATPDLLLSVAEDQRKILLTERKTEEQEDATNRS